VVQDTLHRFSSIRCKWGKKEKNFRTRYCYYF